MSAKVSPADFDGLLITLRKCEKVLTRKSFNQFAALMSRYFLKIENSRSFKEQCRQINDSGGNSLHAWMNRQGFKPEWKAKI